MERKNPRGSVAEEYWTNKLKISLGRTTLFFTNVFKDHPELIEDLKATKRMDIFELYEIEMKRRRCFWFLKLVHKKGEGSLFYNEFLPYDILKIILVFAGIFVKRDIPDFWSFNPFADKPKKSRLPGDFYGIDLQSSL